MFCSVAFAQDDKADTRPGIAPDIREDETRLKLQRGDFVIVPIPISNPTLGSGLVAGAAYFYAQTEEQKKRQPASVTATAAMYTSNDSRAFAVVQQNYWRETLALYRCRRRRRSATFTIDPGRVIRRTKP